jgi:secretion/DNA translocation related TadE-like protein
VSRRVRADHGGATILVVAMAGVLMFVAVGLAAVGGLVTAQRRAQAAADLAALGAASDPGQACGEAARIAAANAAVLDGCQVNGDEVRVSVSVMSPSVAWREVRVSAEARAGPA